MFKLRNWTIFRNKVTLNLNGGHAHIFLCEASLLFLLLTTIQEVRRLVLEFLKVNVFLLWSDELFKRPELSCWILCFMMGLAGRPVKNSFNLKPCCRRETLFCLTQILKCATFWFFTSCCRDEGLRNGLHPPAPDYFRNFHIGRLKHTKLSMSHVMDAVCDLATSCWKVQGLAWKI